jgi:hypothetical protein
MRIDKKVPLPVGGKYKPFKYPWDKLKIGDSFFIPHQHSITNLVQNYNMGVPVEQRIEVTRRLERNGKIAGQRVWRIK